MISYALNVVLLILFAKRLLQWYRSNRNSIVIILYSISALALAFSSIVALVADYRNLIIKEETVITPQSPIIFPSFDPGTLTSLLSDIYRHSNMVATLLVWSTTVLLLYHYFDRLNKLAKVKFWILITLPLIYYLSSNSIKFRFIYSTDRLRSILLLRISFIERHSCRNIIWSGLQDCSKKH